MTRDTQTPHFTPRDSKYLLIKLSGCCKQCDSLPAMDEEDFDNIADEDLIEFFSQSPRINPSVIHGSKKRRQNSLYSNSVEIHNDDSRFFQASEEDGDQTHILDDGTPNSIHNSKFKSTGQLLYSSPTNKGSSHKKSRLENSPSHSLSSAIKDFAYTTQPQTPSSLPRQETLLENSIDAELEGLPSDAFSSPRSQTGDKDFASSISSPLLQSQALSRQRLVAVQQGLRQTTLFGGSVIRDERSPQTARKVYNYIVDQPPEAPTHHALDTEALKTWIYPLNLGVIRDYQYSIVKNGLFSNLLVALPTGLGKTFIAATIMLNYFRWAKTAQIIFVAPTKPLVAQQVEACFNIVGIPRSQTTMLTGEQAPALRAEEWTAKRVFFMTPQTLENDLASGVADPKKIILLVIDEAHRATGNYSYVRVVTFLRRFSKSFRILALTATPGSSVEAVQEIIDNLEISKVEIRTEESIDIQQYVHKRNLDQILLDPSDEILTIKNHLSKAIQPLLNTLCTANAYWNRDPMGLTTFGMVKARVAWMQSEAGRRANPGLKGMMNSLFAVLASIAHSIKLLSFHGISPFYSAIKDFQGSVEDSNKPGKYKSQIINSPDFKKMMDKIESWINKDNFIGHPKISYLCDTILNHFLDAGDGRLSEDAPPSSTRVIVFSEYRDSAEDISRVLNRHRPLIRSSVFVGQADSKRSEGMNQKKQLRAIQEFKSGILNVIVATSIGEEGLDIGQVDLIVCYDSSASPIRMLQRMGRTGRKRAGRIVLLLMKGKEEESFIKAKDNYEQMQKIISSGQRFNFRHDLSVRIIPRDVTPIVEKKIIELPLENTQNPGLPEPKRRPTERKKKPPKKFNMPDGVETSFTTASKLGTGMSGSSRLLKNLKTSKVTNKDLLAVIPSVESVLLDQYEREELQRQYQDIEGDDMQEVSMPEMTSQTVAQRSLRPIGKIPHGKYTKRCVKLFKKLATFQHLDHHDWSTRDDNGISLNSLDLPTLIDESKLRIGAFRSRKPALAKSVQTKKKKRTSSSKIVPQISEVIDKELDRNTSFSSSSSDKLVAFRKSPRISAHISDYSGLDDDDDDIFTEPS